MLNGLNRVTSGGFDASFFSITHATPAKWGATEVKAFLTDLAVNHSIAASTRNQALSALIFLDHHVLTQEEIAEELAHFYTSPRDAHAILVPV